MCLNRTTFLRNIPSGNLQPSVIQDLAYFDGADVWGNRCLKKKIAIFYVIELCFTSSVNSSKKRIFHLRFRWVWKPFYCPVIHSRNLEAIINYMGLIFQQWKFLYSDPYVYDIIHSNLRQNRREEKKTTKEKRLNIYCVKYVKYTEIYKMELDWPCVYSLYFLFPCFHIRVL